MNPTPFLVSDRACTQEEISTRTMVDVVGDSMADGLQSMSSTAWSWLAGCSTLVRDWLNGVRVAPEENAAEHFPRNTRSSTVGALKKQMSVHRNLSVTHSALSNVGPRIPEYRIKVG